MPNRIEAALLLVPFEVAVILAIYGAEQAFTWTGQAPRDDREFYVELGRKMSAMTITALANQLRSEGHQWD